MSEIVKVLVGRGKKLHFAKRRGGGHDWEVVCLGYQVNCEEIQDEATHPLCKTCLEIAKKMEVL